MCIAGVAFRKGLMLTNDCPCPGNNLTYECTTVGEGSTVWQGGIFDCPDRSNEITLRHINFASTVTGECNAGAVVGESLRAVDNCYTSQLSILYTEEYVGKTVACAYDNGITTTVVGTSPITHNTTGIHACVCLQ